MCVAGRVDKQILIGIFCFLSLSLFRKVTGQSWSIRVIKIARSGLRGYLNKLLATVLGVMRWEQEQ